MKFLRNILKKRTNNLPFIINPDKTFSIKDGVYVYLMDSHNPCSGWGDSIKWFNFKSNIIVGWKRRIPEKDEVVKAILASGRSAFYHILEVDRQRDPCDMFFATLKNIGYENGPCEYHLSKS